MMNAGTRNSRTGAAAVALFCALAAFAVFSPILGGSFTFDDNAIQLYHVPSWKSVKDAFAPPKIRGALTDYYYRPLVTLTYMADEAANNALHGPAAAPLERTDPKRAAIPHATTLLLHALATALVVFLADLFLKERPGRLAGLMAAGLLFALHPVHAETALNVAGRSDSLAAVFMTAWLLLSVRGAETRNTALSLAAGIAFFLALLSKETALTGIVLLFLLILWRREGKTPETKSLLAMAASTGTALFFYAALRIQAGTVEIGGAETGFTARAAETAKALGFYVRKIIIPWPSTPFVTELPGGAETLAALAVAAAFAAFAAHSFRKGHKSGAFAAAWFAVTLAPALYLVGSSTTTAVAAERFLYIPGIGVVIMAATAVAKASQGGRFRLPVYAALSLLLAAYACTSFTATSIWKNDLSLWEYVTSMEGPAKTGMPWLNLGNEYVKAGDLDKAETAYGRALAPGVKTSPETMASVSCSLGMVQLFRSEELVEKGNYAEAEALLRTAELNAARATASGFENFLYYGNLGRIKTYQATMSFRKGQPDRAALASARYNLEKADALNPGNAIIAEYMREYETLLNNPPPPAPATPAAPSR